jgi:hypothetical protein
MAGEIHGLSRTKCARCDTPIQYPERVFFRIEDFQIVATRKAKDRDIWTEWKAAFPDTADLCESCFTKYTHLFTEFLTGYHAPVKIIPAEETACHRPRQTP